MLASSARGTKMEEVQTIESSDFEMYSKCAPKKKVQHQETEKRSEKVESHRPVFYRFPSCAGNQTKS